MDLQIRPGTPGKTSNSYVHPSGRIPADYGTGVSFTLYELCLTSFLVILSIRRKKLITIRLIVSVIVECLTHVPAKLLESL